MAHPFHAAIEALEGSRTRWWARSTATRSAAASSLRSSCDIRIAAQGVKLGMPPAKLGLVYSHTGLRKFVEASGRRARRALLRRPQHRCRPRRLRWGSSTTWSTAGELDERAVEMAAEIAANAPLSLSGNKRILRELRAHASALPEDVERELVALRESCFRTEDFREGVRAFGEKRAPSWRNR